MEKIRTVAKHIPTAVWVIVCVFAVSVLLHVSFMLSVNFSDLYCRTAGSFFRGVAATVTNPFPMSLAEALLISLPFILVYLCIKAIGTNGEVRAVVRLLSGIVSVALLAYSLFVLTFAAGFYASPVETYFGLEKRNITVDELYEAAMITVDGVNGAYAEIEGRGPASTSIGMSVDEMNDLLLDSFGELYGEYGFPAKLNSRVKPVVLSHPMTYTHISGIYSYFTGEANINVNYPDFVIPYTAAHELSHQRGVSREDEANFVAFLVCIKSDDPYVRYSGYLNMYQYMSSALYSVSYERYAELADQLNDGVKAELIAYSNFFDRYRDNVAADISDAVNDTYLSVMSGTDSRSYGMVVDLATVYLLGE